MRQLKHLIFLTLMCLCCTLQALAGYSGSPSEPSQITAENYTDYGFTADNYSAFVGYYGIRNAEELYGFAAKVNSGSTSINGVLTADIVVNDSVLKADGSLKGTPTYSWTPIGTSSYAYAGTFDGQSHTISGLYFNNTNTSYVGLFGYIDNPTIKNVGLVDSYLKGNRYVGGIAGYIRGAAQITNCHNAATVYANYDGDSFAGGICGYMYNSSALIDGCCNTGYVSGYYRYVGGICGYQYNGTITNSYNTGKVYSYAINSKTNESYAGGISGWMNNTASISNCHNTGDVEAYGKYAGGITGYMYNSNNRVTNCYNLGNVKANQYSGGICGHENYGTISYCYNAGSVTGGTNVGGIYGSKNSASTSNNYVLSGSATYSNGGNFATAEEFASGLIAFRLNGSENGVATWRQNLSGIIDSLPVLDKTHGVVYMGCESVMVNNPADAPHTFVDGVCSVCHVSDKPILSDGWYEIENKYHLIWFAEQVNSGKTNINGKLVADIVMNDNVLTEDGSLNGDGSSFTAWTPIGTSSYKYAGTFDGQDHTISGLYFENTSSSYVGLFGYVSSPAIKNVGLVDSYIKGNEYVGGIAGYVSGSAQITNCHNAATVYANNNGDSDAGGICGCLGNASALVDNCYNTGYVSGYKEDVGGICGYQAYGRITNSYNTGKVYSSAGNSTTNNAYAGGISGYMNNSASIANCYNTGNVEAYGKYAGGIAGYMYYSSNRVTNCYNLGSVTANQCSGGICGEYNGAINNCYNAGSVTGNSSVGGIYGSKIGAALTSNNYVLSGSATNSNGGNFATAEEFASGLISFQLNGSVSGAATWRQNLSGTVDPLPVLDTVHGRVYLSEPCRILYCNTDTTIEHQYDDFGQCTVCHKYLPAMIVADAAMADSLGLSDDYVGFYAIQRASDLHWFADLVNSNTNRAAKAVLLNDIVVNDSVLTADGSLNGTPARTWTPIGTSSYAYAGTFDGQDHTISGLYFNNTSKSYVGLFGYISNPTIKNVGLVDSYLKGYQDVGGIAGYIDGAAQITNCYNAATVYANYTYGYVGGICGRLGNTSALIDNCCNIGYVSGYYQYVGGICGYQNNGTITNSYNTGRVYANAGNSKTNYAYAGGISGYMNNSASISNCYNTGDVEARGYYSGGITGYMRSSSNRVTCCFNLGSVKANDDASGITAYQQGTTTNNFALSGSAASCDGGTFATAEEFASGKVAYALNGNTSSGTLTWFQTIGTDSLPVWDNTHAMVYVSEPCHVEYSNSATTLEHQYDDFSQCTVCGAYMPATLVADAAVADSLGLSADYVGFYAIGNAAQLYYFAQMVNSGSTSIKGVLLDNIVVNDRVLDEEGNLNGTPARVWTPIGTDSYAYAGTFDGQDHTISGLYFNNTNTSNVGLFGYISKPTIKNVGLVDSYLKGNQYVGGIAGYVNGAAQITNCYNAATVFANFYGDSDAGGICGYLGNASALIDGCCNTGYVSGYLRCVGGICGIQINGTITNSYNTGRVDADAGYNTGNNAYAGGISGYMKNSASISNCYNAGDVEAYGRYAGGITGYMRSSSNRVTNCYNLGSVKANQNASGITAYRQGTTTNNFALSGSVASCDGGTFATAEDFASGRVAYALNDSVSGGSRWRQNIGEDFYPVPDATHGFVYTNSPCPFSNDSVQPQAHVMVNGICVHCCLIEEPTLIANEQAAIGFGLNADYVGYYAIENTGHLYWFSESVNSGTTTIKGVLVDDIVVNDSVLDSNSSLISTNLRVWNPIGTSENTYAGTFDGNGHTVSGLYFNNKNASYVGLFGYTNGATIKKVGVVDSYFRGEQYVGGIAGRLYNGSTISDCYNAGKITRSRNYINNGGVCGVVESNCSISNSYNVGAVNTNAIARKNGGDITNCYYLAGTSAVADDGTAFTAADFASGKVTFALNGNTSEGNIVWYQTIGIDALPTSDNSHGVVYESSNGFYSNTPANQAIPITDNNYEIYNLTADYVGYYAIADATQLYWFANLVNNGTTNAKALLLADIVVNANVLGADGTLNGNPSDYRTWTPIGTDSYAYAGTFDGQGHTISGLYFNNTNTLNVGLFGYISNPTIKNVGLVDSYLKGNRYVGGIAGFVNGAAQITNCYNGASLFVDYNSITTESYVGGICGYGGTQINCYNTGKISGASYSGGICGYGGTQTNCYNTFAGEHQYFGGICGNNGTQTNCYNLSSSSWASGSVSYATAEEFASGKIAYKLNGSKSTGNLAWFQTIGTDQLPVLNNTHDTVWLNCSNNTYVNSSDEVTHVAGDYVRANYVAPRCTTAGSCDSVVRCSVCNTVLIRNSFVFPALGHSYDTTTFITSCYNESYRDATCQRCGDFVRFDTIPAKGHHGIADAFGMCPDCGLYIIAPFFIHTANEADSLGLNSSYVNYYAIENAAQLYWFVKLVNGGSTNVNAVLTADIVVNEDVLTAEGNLNGNGSNFKLWEPIGNNSFNIVTGTYNKYTGTFDGNSHTISGLYFYNTSTNNVGLFGNTNGATIKNVGVVDSYFNGNQYIGGICGYASSTAITNCFSTSALVSNANNYYNSYSGATGAPQYEGGICGYGYNSTITSCYSTGLVKFNTGEYEGYIGGICGYRSSTTITRCYYLSGTVGRYGNGKGVGCGFKDSAPSDVSGEIASATAAQFADGTVALAMNGGTNEGPWFQSVGVDASPVLDASHGRVGVLSTNGNVVTVSGDMVFSENYTVAAGHTLVIPADASVRTVGSAVITNNGTIMANGRISGNNLAGSGSFLYERISAADITLNAESFPYRGRAYTIGDGITIVSVERTMCGKTFAYFGDELDDASAYRITYTNNKNVSDEACIVWINKSDYTSISKYFSITPIELTVSSITADSKEYDGTTAATATVAFDSASVIAGETVTVSCSAAFADASVGEGKTVNYSLTIGGANAANYTFASLTGTTTADITTKQLTVNAEAENKTFDGTTAATGSLTLEGVLSGENVTLSYSAAAFADANVGTNKAVTFSGLTIGGTNSANYSLADSTAAATASITADSTVVVTITENSGTETYSGNEQTISGYTVDINSALYTEDDFAFSGTDEVKGTTVGTYEMNIAPSDFENTNPNFANVTFSVIDGALTITKADSAPDMPQALMETHYISTQLVALPDNWQWAEIVALELGDNAVTALYAGADTGNYLTESINITLTRLACLHNEGSDTLYTLAPTCTHKGYEGNLSCNLCGEIFEYGDSIPALGHAYDTAIIAPTCTAVGYTQLTCSRCGDVAYIDTVPANGHTAGEPVAKNYVAPSCTVVGSVDSVVYCTVDSAEISRNTFEIAALGHAYDTAVIAPTCTVVGYTQLTCSRCGDVAYIDTVPATGHTAGEAVAENYVAPTCTVVGSVDSVVYCTVDSAEISRNTFEIAAPGHTADSIAFENVVAATCTTAGSYDSVVYCSVCHVEISRDEIEIPATGHKADSIAKENIVAATCTTAGSYDSIVYCSVCRTEISRDTINVPANGHVADSIAFENVVAATCTTAGSYDSVVYCSVCRTEISRDTINVPATGHIAGAVVIENYIAPTITTEGSGDSVIYCTVCGEELSRTAFTLPVSEHEHIAGAPVAENYNAPTCTAAGSVDSVVYCTVNGELLSRTTHVIPATGHTADSIAKENIVAATCTTAGSYDSVVYCSVCHVEISRDEIEIPATGHKADSIAKENIVAATCTTAGSYDSVVYCSVCHAEISRNTIVIPATGHSAGEPMVTYVAPTCTETGYTDTTIYCTIDSTIISSISVGIPALGHAYDTVTVAPTCTEVGYKTATCSRCGDIVRFDTVPATGHIAGEAVVENYIAPTMTTEGSGDSVVYCTVCSEELSRTAFTVPVSDHVHIAGAPVAERYVAPTCTTAGSVDSVVYCTVNGELLSRTTHVIPATGHKADSIVKENIVAATCTTAGSYDSVVYCSVCGTEISRTTIVVPQLVKPVEVEVVDVDIDKLEYTVGDSLKLDGGKLVIATSDSTTAEVVINPDMVSGFNPDSIGVQTVTVEFEIDGVTYTATFEVEVKAPEVIEVVAKSLALSANPAKVAYKKGEALDVTGGKLSVTFSDNSIKEFEITADMVSGFDAEKVGVQTLTVTFKAGDVTLTATFEVTVEADDTAVDDEAANTANIYAYGNTIVVENATDEIRVYNAMGGFVAASNEANAKIRVNGAGIYIVKTGQVSKRVMVY